VIGLSERFDVRSTRERVWAILSDPHAVVSCVPGAAIVAENDDGTFDATMSIKFGPTTIPFTARVAVKLDEASVRGRVEATGKERVGGTRIHIESIFAVAAELDPSLVSVNIRGSVDVVGRLATLIEGGAALVVKRMSGDFAERLAALCAAREPQPAEEA
jgi:carbon monoxide dehydrogenase subunit G